VSQVAGCAPLAGATAQRPQDRRNRPATAGDVQPAVSPMTGRELRAQLRAQQASKYLPVTSNSEPLKVATCLPELPHYRWRVFLADGTPFEVCCLPELTAAEMRELYPGVTITTLPDAPEAGE
jgi:hypothetical protein